MKPFSRFILRLYPRAWRERYRDELETLIEDSGSGWRSTLDLLKEAIRMQFTTWSFGKLATLLGLAGLILAAVTSRFIPPTYVSDAELGLSPSGRSDDSSPIALSNHLLRMENAILSRTSLASVIKDPRLNLYASERQSTPLEDVIEKMRRQDIRIAMDSPSTFEISFRYPDKRKAQQTVQALITKFQGANLDLDRTGVYAGAHIQVIDPPTLPMYLRLPFLPTDWQDMVPIPGFRPVYESRAELAMVPAASSENNQQLTDQLMRMEKEVLSRTILATIIQDPRLDLYSQERKSMPLEDVIEKMRRRDIHINTFSLPGSNIPAFTISFRYPDRYKAQATLYALMTRLLDADRTAQRELEALRNMPPQIMKAGINLNVIDPPTLPVLPAKPNRYYYALIGLTIGIMSAGIVRLLSKLRTTTAA